MGIFAIITVAVKNGKVINLLVAESEKDAIEHAHYCLDIYGGEKEGVTEIIVLQHNNDGIVEVICDLSGEIRNK